MSDAPWLTIIGLGEDGPDGLPPATREMLMHAEIIMAPPRHLGLLPALAAEQIEWPVPFADGIEILLGLRGRQAVVLASGDPFWYGAGSVIAKHLKPSEWCALPGVSSFSIAAARLGWPLETTLTMGLHAAPLTRLRPHLSPGLQVIVTLRDRAAVQELAEWLTKQGFDNSTLHVMEALGGPKERLRSATATNFGFDDISHPVCVALDVVGDGQVLPTASGRPDEIFETDGQITKRPVRALTLSALAPQRGENLWDIGGGTGSIAIEWLLSHPTTSASAIELSPERAARITRNAIDLGVDRLSVVTGSAPEVLMDLPAPDAVFIGGGLSVDMLGWLVANLQPGTRVVANAVTLESEALLTQWYGKLGGDLLRIELARATPLGAKQGWKSAYPVVQWSVVL